MHFKDSQRYILNIFELHNKHPKIDDVSLDILEQFAFEEYLSSYNIYIKLEQMNRKMAYKNVNKRIHGLVSLELILEISLDHLRNKHNAKYYRLTDYGIYQLFLKKLQSTFSNQFELRRNYVIQDNTLNFFRNYNNNKLFNLFINPYFETKTLIGIGRYILLILFHYLNRFCNMIETTLSHIHLPVMDTLFAWDKVPGVHEENLLLHLKEIFNIKSISNEEIKKDNNEKITVFPNKSSPSIVIKLDKSKKKVEMISTVNDQYKNFKFDIIQIGSDMLVVNPKNFKKLVENIINDSKREFEQLLYEFVCEFPSKMKSIKAEEFSYYCTILSEDEKFIKILEQIYHKKHKEFELGYEMLIKKNKSENNK